MKQTMGKQWDLISTENAFFGVLSQEMCENPDAVDVENFFKTGREHVESFMKLLDFEDTKSLHMLEIGCGLGRMTHHFSRLFGKVYAVDVSQEMLNRAKNYWEQLDNVEWVLVDGESLQPIASESVDFVFSFWVLQHIPDANVVLNYICETKRILKNNGIALLQFRVMPSDSILTRVKYYIFTHWPSSLTKFLMGIWDVFKGHAGLRAKFAREYSAWRGCALPTKDIQAAATENHLRILASDSLGTQSSGTQSRYYIFQKTNDFHS